MSPAVQLFLHGNKENEQTEEQKHMEDQLKEKGFVLNAFKGELENINLSNDFFNRIKIMEFGAFFLGWLGLGSCMVYYEYEYYVQSEEIEEEDIYQMDSTKRRLTILLYINLLCTLGVLSLIYFRYVLTIKLYQSKHLLSGLDTLITTDWYKPLLLELLLNLITPSPFFKNTTIYTYYNDMNLTLEESLNDTLLASSMMIRIYLIVRFYMTCFSEYRQPRH